LRTIEKIRVYTVAYAENFHGGGFIQWHMVSFVFGARCS